MINVRRVFNQEVFKSMACNVDTAIKSLCTCAATVEEGNNTLCLTAPSLRSLKAQKNVSLVNLTQKMSYLSRRGEIVNARKVFDRIRLRDSISWNVMIRCYLENNMVEGARELFDEMPERTSVSWNTMIGGYVKLGKAHVALKLFVVMPEKDVLSWTAMVTGLCQAGRVDDAWWLFKQMPDANAVAWSSIVSGFQQNGFANESLNVLKEMLSVGILPTAHSFTSTLSACADLAIISMSEQMYCQALKRGFDCNTHVGNSSISAFVKTGSFHYAMRIFLELNEPDLVTWNAMIMGFAQHGCGVEAIMTFHQMQKAGVLPDRISYLGVLHGCSHCGLVEEGRRYFLSMTTDHGISPGVDHFCAMVDLYSRSGNLKEAYNIIFQLPFEPTSVMWRTLLNGCKIWRDMELGVCAAEQILKLEPYSSGACLMITNIFALAGKWKEVATIRRHMRAIEARKELGCSWIDVKGRSYLFTNSDDHHSEADNIFMILDLLAHDITWHYLDPEIGELDGISLLAIMICI